MTHLNKEIIKYEPIELEVRFCKGFLVLDNEAKNESANSDLSRSECDGQIAIKRMAMIDKFIAKQNNNLKII